MIGLGPQLRTLHLGGRELPQGYVFRFSADPKTVTPVAEWAAGVRLGCPFLAIQLDLNRERGPLWLELSARPGTEEFIHADFPP